MSTSAGDGTKVTTDPATLNDPKIENPGMVTSDSLAAESIADGGSFAATSDVRGPMDQPSYSTNTNTTDVSNATRLEPAPDAEARQASEEWSEAAQLNAGSSLGDGRGPTERASGMLAGTGGDLGDSSFEDRSQPKGKNLREGGFDSDAPNASWTTDIGSKKDPGRRALQDVDVPVSGGTGPRQGQVTDDGQFDVLKDASA